MERNSTGRHRCEIDIVNYCTPTHTTPMHIWNGRAMWIIVIWKRMCRRHFHIEKGTTTTLGTRTEHTHIVCGLSENLWLSQSRTTTENPQTKFTEYYRKKQSSFWRNSTPEKVKIEATVGVIQSNNLGPIFFICLNQAVATTLSRQRDAQSEYQTSWL